MSLLQIELLKEAAQVDLVLGALYVTLGSFGLLCIWHISHTRRQLERQNRQQIRREWRKLNLRGNN
jgi:hypothetical protein